MACAAIARRKSRIVVLVSCAGKTHVIPHMAGFAIAYTNSCRTGMDGVDRLRHPVRVNGIGMAIAAGHERFVVPVCVAQEAVEVRVARGTGTEYAQRVVGTAVSGRAVIASRPARLVAGDAILPAVGSPGMVPARRNPGAATVALVTGSGRRDVCSMFTLGDSAVMTGSAVARPGRAMVVARPQKGRRIEVAGLAWSTGHNMTGGFRRRHDALPRSMTTIATPWRPLEHPFRMASLACRAGMSARERKTCGRMFEVASHSLSFGM